MIKGGRCRIFLRIPCKFSVFSAISNITSHVTDLKIECKSKFIVSIFTFFFSFFLFQRKARLFTNYKTISLRFGANVAFMPKQFHMAILHRSKMLSSSLCFILLCFSYKIIKLCLSRCGHLVFALQSLLPSAVIRQLAF